MDTRKCLSLHFFFSGGIDGKPDRFPAHTEREREALVGHNLWNSFNSTREVQRTHSTRGICSNISAVDWKMPCVHIRRFQKQFNPHLTFWEGRVEHNPVIGPLVKIKRNRGFPLRWRDIGKSSLYPWTFSPDLIWYPYSKVLLQVEKLVFSRIT